METIEISKEEYANYQAWKAKQGTQFKYYSPAHNPFSKEHCNSSAQSEIAMANIDKAIELCKAADNRHALPALLSIKEKRDRFAW